MKKTYSLMMALLLTVAAVAQTLNVKVGNVIYQFPASQTGEMIYSNGDSLTIMGKTLALNNIDNMTVGDNEVTDGTISVAYSNTSATVFVAGNIARYVTPQ